MSLRILHIATGMPGWAGTEKYIVDLSQLLAKRDHRVVVACRPGSEIDERSRQNGIPVIPLTMRKTHDWRQLPSSLEPCEDASTWLIFTAIATISSLP
jgi:hypothetical protein